MALVDFLRTKDQEVLLHTARAIHVLSREAKFCGLLEHVGISELFVRMIGASSPAFQIAAAGTIGRICKVGQNSESLARQLTSAQCMRGTEMRASHET
ncbi:unnamed protein product [Protopolystoma xenopodis]|uniref:Armadillo repeat-containing domain-containing protein n=1 Tax=Protopolystoma xenopodis TaxID=117903 RepID=A0A3S5B451_9PLAT|nr:unnamed protein product [Protopolystoma xenopodis]